MKEIMRITAHGKVTIPKEIRHSLGFLPHTEVCFVQKGDRVYLEKITNENSKKMTRGQKIIAHMRGTGTVKMTTDEIMALTRGDD